VSVDNIFGNGIPPMRFQGDGLIFQINQNLPCKTKKNFLFIALPVESCMI
jgi:hypothetical protein